MDELLHSSVNILKSSDFENNSLYLKNKNCSFILFYTNWCQYCQNIKPEYIKFANIAQFLNICAINCEDNESLIKKMEKYSNIKIEGYPTIYIYKNGKPLKKYKQKKEIKDFLKCGMNICDTKCKCNSPQ